MFIWFLRELICKELIGFVCFLRRWVSCNWLLEFKLVLIELMFVFMMVGSLVRER